MRSIIQLVKTVGWYFVWPKYIKPLNATVCSQIGRHVLVKKKHQSSDKSKNKHQIFTCLRAFERIMFSMLLSNIFLFFFFHLSHFIPRVSFKMSPKEKSWIKNKLTKNINLHSTKDTFAVSLFFIVILLTYETSPQWVKIWQETALSSQHQKNRSSSDNVIWVEDLCYKM